MSAFSFELLCDVCERSLGQFQTIDDYARVMTCPGCGKEQRPPDLVKLGFEAISKRDADVEKASKRQESLKRAVIDCLNKKSMERSGFWNKRVHPEIKFSDTFKMEFLKTDKENKYKQDLKKRLEQSANSPISDLSEEDAIDLSDALGKAAKAAKEGGVLGGMGTFFESLAQSARAREREGKKKNKDEAMADAMRRTGQQIQEKMKIYNELREQYDEEVAEEFLRRCAEEGL